MLKQHFIDTQIHIYEELVRSKYFISHQFPSVYKNMTCILPNGTKSQILRTPVYEAECEVHFDSEDAIQMSTMFLNNGYNPLTMCTTKTHYFDQSCDVLDQETNMLLRTSILHSLQSVEYNTILKNLLKYHDRQCISTFIPSILVSKSHEFKRLTNCDYRYVNVLLLPSTKTCENYNQDVREKIIKGKLNTLFDAALQQRKDCSFYLDSLIFTDLYCRTPDEVATYVESVSDLMKTYKHHFRKIGFSITNNTLLLNSLKSKFTS
jgi:hypothetical protein